MNWTTECSPKARRRYLEAHLATMSSRRCCKRPRWAVFVGARAAGGLARCPAWPAGQRARGEPSGDLAESLAPEQLGRLRPIAARHRPTSCRSRPNAARQRPKGGPSFAQVGQDPPGRGELGPMRSTEPALREWCAGSAGVGGSGVTSRVAVVGGDDVCLRRDVARSSGGRSGGPAQSVSAGKPAQTLFESRRCMFLPISELCRVLALAHAQLGRGCGRTWNDARDIFDDVGSVWCQVRPPDVPNSLAWLWPHVADACRALAELGES